jgi:hypothetical protein
MTKKEAIEYLKQDIEGNLNGRVNIEKRTLKKILDAFNDEPTDDIPIGAPCKGYIGTKQFKFPKLGYNKGSNCLNWDVDNLFIDEGAAVDYLKPLTIWDIPEKYGGAPEWAIARAYNRDDQQEWVQTERRIEELMFLDWIIERRPKEK